MDKEIHIQNQINAALTSIFSDQAFRTRQKKEKTEDDERRRIREELEQRQKKLRQELEEIRIERLRKMGVSVVKVEQTEPDKTVYKMIPSPHLKPQTLSPFDQFLKDNEICDNDLCRKIKEVYNSKVEEAKKAGGCNSCKMNAIKRSMATYIEAYQKFLATRQKSSCTSGTCALPSPTEKQ